jgi:hypothetical protein
VERAEDAELASILCGLGVLGGERLWAALESEYK